MVRAVCAPYRLAFFVAEIESIDFCTIYTFYTAKTAIH